MLRFNIDDSVSGMQKYFGFGEKNEELNKLFAEIVKINSDHFSRNIVWRGRGLRTRKLETLKQQLKKLVEDWKNEYKRTENEPPGGKGAGGKISKYIRQTILFVLSPSVCAILVLITTWIFAGTKLEEDFQKYETGCALIRSNNTFDRTDGIKTEYTEYFYFNDGWYSYGQNCTRMCLTQNGDMYTISETYTSIYPGPCFHFDKEKDKYVCEADNTNRSVSDFIDERCITKDSVLSSTVLAIISGVMTFMLTWSLNAGLEKEREQIKLYEALVGDVKAMAMFLVHLTEDKQKYGDLNRTREMSQDAKDQFFKMQLLLTQIAPTARKILQGKRAYIFPEYHGDSNSFIDDCIEGRVKNTKRYEGQFKKYRRKIGGVKFLFFVSLVLICVGAFYPQCLIPGIPILLFTSSLIVFAPDEKRCGWKCCCRATPYADVEDLETIPYYEKRKEKLDLFWKAVFLLCCKSTTHKRAYRRWSDECELGTCPGVEKSLYNKIKTISEETTMDLFETEMSVLLDEITRLSENQLGFGSGKNVLKHIIQKWHHIYGSYGTLQSIAQYKEPFSVLSYRAGMLLAYSFLVPYKYIQLHDMWNYGKKTNLLGETANGIGYTGQARGFLPDPYLYWSVLDILVFSFMWWCGYFIRKPFSKTGLRRYAICGRQKSMDKISEDTQIQVNNLMNNARRYDEQDYKMGIRYGWGGISKTNFTPIGLDKPPVKKPWVDNYDWRDCIEKMLTLTEEELLKMSPLDKFPFTPSFPFPTILDPIQFRQFVNMFPLNGIYVPGEFNINGHPDEDEGKKEITLILKQLVNNYGTDEDNPETTQFFEKGRPTSKKYNVNYKNQDATDTSAPIQRNRTSTYQPLTF